MTTLNKIPGSLAIADQLQVMGDLRPMIEKHKDFVASKHEDGATFVEEVLGAYDDARAKDLKADKEGGEADVVLGEHTKFYEDAREHIGETKRRVRLAVRFLMKDKKQKEKRVKEARALLRDYGITGNQSNINRASHVERALTRIVAAHELHGPMLQTWGSDAAFIQAGKDLVASRPDLVRRLTKERSEAEQANDERNEALALAVEEFNDVLFIVETFKKENPAAAADFKSVLNKHRSLLVAASAKDDKGDQGDEAEEGERDQDDLGVDLDDADVDLDA